MLNKAQRATLLQAILLSSTSIAASFAMTPASQAQGQAASSDEEIVITARKREERLIEVPAAVSAISPTQLSNANATDLSSISKLVPQLQITSAGSGNGGSLVMRGIGSAANDAGLESQVLINIDGIPSSRGWVTQTSFFDVESVQVLKGPQALFFGKNSPAGVVAIDSKGPGAEWEGFLRTGYEFVADERFFEAAIGGPLSPDWGARVAFRYGGMEGWIENRAQPIANNPLSPLYPTPGATTNKRAPNQDSVAGRLTLEWHPSSDFTGELKIQHSYLDNKSGLTGQSQAVACAPGNAHPSTLGVQDPYMDCVADRYTALSAVPAELASNWSKMDSLDPFLTNSSTLTSLKLDYEVGPINITSVTGFSDYDVNGSGNFDSSSFIQIPSVVGEKFTSYSQEIRAESHFDGPVNAFVGIYFEKQEINAWNIARIPVSPIPSRWIVPDPVTGKNEQYYSDNTQVSKTISPFVQLSWNIMENLELAGGVRYTYETKKAKLGNKFTNQGIAPGGTSPSGAAYRAAGDYLYGDFKDTKLSPELTLTWNPTENSTLYAAYRSGYKSGGFSITGVLVAGGTIDPLTYGSESSDGFDVGYKARLLDGRLILDLVGYRYEYEDLQRSILDIPTTTFIIQNAAGARVQGIEASASYDVTSELTLRLSAAYNSAEYSSYPNAPCYAGQTAAQGCITFGTTRAQDLTGLVLPFAPELVATASFSYDTPITAGWNIGIDGSVDYNTGYVTADTHHPFEKQGAFFRLHAGLRLYETDGPLSFDLIGRNLTNEYILAGASAKVFGSPGDLTGVIERPRQILLQVSYRY